MKDVFGTYHPIINFAYFCAVILFSMFFLHPVFQAISVVAAFIYSIFLNGKRAVIFNLAFLLPAMILVALINPLFNHRGVTILGYLGNNPITQESILYGISTGLLFAGVILWFSCYNAIMTSDKFIYLFGRVIPSLSLIFSMVLRFVPRFKTQAVVISGAQKCIGRDASNGNLLSKAKNGLKILSILTTWALESAVDTADSMNARGYGLPGRTAFSLFRFDLRDKSLLLILVGVITVILAGAALGLSAMRFFPAVRMAAFSPGSLAVYTAYGILCFLPLILNAKEAFRWKHLQSKI